MKCIHCGSRLNGCKFCNPNHPEYVKPSATSAANEERVLKAVYESGLHQYAPGVLCTKWKDGIDINIPSSALMNFVKKLQAA